MFPIIINFPFTPFIFIRLVKYVLICRECTEKRHKFALNVKEHFTDSHLNGVKKYFLCG